MKLKKLLKNKRAWLLAAVSGVFLPAALWASSMDFGASSVIINCESQGCNIPVNQAVAPAPADVEFGGTTNLDTLKLASNLIVNTVSSTNVLVNGIDSDDDIDFVGYTTYTVDPDSIGNGSVTSTPAITVTGASVGDVVNVALPANSIAAPTSSVMIYGVVTTANTVKLVFQNTSSSAVNLTGATYGIEVSSH